MNERAIDGIPDWAESVSVGTVREMLKEERQAGFVDGYDACREELYDAEDAETEAHIFNPESVTLYIDGIPIVNSGEFTYKLESDPDADWADDLAEQTVNDFDPRCAHIAMQQIAADLRTAHRKGREEYKAELDAKSTTGHFYTHVRHDFAPVSVGFCTGIQRGEN